MIADDILIDEQDRHWIEGRKVWLSSGYPTIHVKGRGQIRLHQLIMEPGEGFGVDHINRNKLDARRANLRICTQAENTLNAPARKDSRSGVRGVWFDEARGKWTVQISRAGKRQHIGRFDEFQRAVMARKDAEKVVFGEFAPV